MVVSRAGTGHAHAAPRGIPRAVVDNDLMFVKTAPPLGELDLRADVFFLAELMTQSTL